MRSLEDLERVFSRGLKAWEKDIMVRESKKIGQKAIREIKKLTPVDTGNLRRRWFCRVRPGSREIIIWLANDADYAAMVNNGHRIARAKKTAAWKDGHYMLEKGVNAYKVNYLKQDIDNMYQKLKEAMK